MGKYEVTFEEYDRFVAAAGKKKPKDRGWGRGKRPVINVSWKDARAYAIWLSKQTGETYRLPTEAEWEYSARAGTMTPFNTGECISTAQANYNGNYGYTGCGPKTGVYHNMTVEVGLFPVNAFGLHDMHGNVWELVEDCWHGNYLGAPFNGNAWQESGNCSHKVIRGGGWDNGPGRLRSANRDWLKSDGANGVLGFRLARTL